jgi:hypothetical protein
VLRREQIVEELEERMVNTTGVGIVLRNPDVEPSIEDLAIGYIVTLVELDDLVTATKHRGPVPINMRALNLVLEVFVAGSTSSAASKELIAALGVVKSSVYATPVRWKELGAVFTEKGYSRVLRPPVGNHVAGIGIEFTIQYTEDNTQLGG